MNNRILELETTYVEKDQAVAWIVLNRPKKLNAMNKQMQADLIACLDFLRTDTSVRAVIVRGEGERALCAQPAEAPLEVGESGDAHRFVQRAAPGVPHECGHRSGHGGDGAGAAGKLFDVDVTLWGGRLAGIESPWNRSRS